MTEALQINQLLREVETITKSYKLVSKATGEKFNIFSILNIETDETNTHSRFIAELLSQNGSHGQGKVFMEKFLENLSIENFDIEKGYDTYIEYYAGKISKDAEKGGRIDILIRSKQGEVILIENKIYAKEQQKQLYRYSNSFPNAKKILFLTLYGKGSEDSYSKKIEYERISYSNHIVNWLEDCKKEAVNSPILRETINQYINLVKKLTGQNLNTQMSKDIVSRVLQDRESVDAYIRLTRARNDIYKTVIKDTAIPLFKKIAIEYNFKLNIDEKALINGAGRYNSLWYENDELEKLNLVISFAFNTPGRNAKDFIFGLAYLDMKNKQAINKYDEIRIQFDTAFGDSKESNHYLRWKDYKGYKDWDNFYVIKAIHFKDFEKDIKIKIDKILEVIKNT
jgi:hypothetical protein